MSQKINYKKVPLWYKGKIVKYSLVDEEDYEKIKKYQWHLKPMKKLDGYAVTKEWVDEKRITIYMHRLIMNIVNVGRDIVVDHINIQKTLDNRKTNLRVCNKTESARHRRKKIHSKKNSKYRSKYIGVTKQGKSWNAHIDDKQLGSFATEIEAARAYDIAAKERDSKFHYTNNIDSGIIPVAISREAKFKSKFFGVYWVKTSRTWECILNPTKNENIYIASSTSEIIAAKLRDFTIKKLGLEDRIKLNNLDTSDVICTEKLENRIRKIKDRLDVVK